MYYYSMLASARLGLKLHLSGQVRLVWRALLNRRIFVGHRGTVDGATVPMCTKIRVGLAMPGMDRW